LTTLSKYRAQKVSHDGRSFASKLEAAVYNLLKLREKAGEIEILQAQSHVYLTKSRIHYIPDFKIFDKELNETIWVEAKGVETATWRIKKKLWEFYGPGRLEIYRGKYTKVIRDDVVHNRSSGEDAVHCPKCDHIFTSGGEK